MSRLGLRALLLSALAGLPVIGLLALAAGTARADVFGTTTLLSASPFGQAEYAHDPALSEEGNYIVFDGSVGGVEGVWRRATSPGSSFEQVAGGDATLPSVSADGQYVSFTTNEGARLPAITDGQSHSGLPAVEAPGVYVRNMDIAADQPCGEPLREECAFTLASAKDHSAQSLAYEFPGAGEEELKFDTTHYGATAAGRSAITADGSEVAFVTTAQSDLAGTATPPLQVAVRNLGTRETSLVSVRFDPATGRPALNEAGEPEPVSLSGVHGAVWSSEGPPAFDTESRGRPEAYQSGSLPGASISADGSTVAWLGEQISEQARTLSEETFEKRYAEPLWRRISGGVQEPTRRVTGGSDPENPACQAHPEAHLPSKPSASDPCQGPFATQESGFGTWNNKEEADVIPRLSANGDYVAFIATVPLTAETGGFGIGGEEYNGDAYRVDMSAPDRDAALTQLTQFASAERSRIATNGNVDDIGISPDGSQVAFTTARTVFPLGAPAYVSTPAAVPGLVELYDADLADDTLTRVTQGYNGLAPEHVESERGTEDRYERAYDGALSPSFTASGTALAFSSTASNLVFGDGNTPPLLGSTDFDDGADVFLVPRIIFSPQPTPQTISPPPPNPVPVPPWKLGVSATSLADGAVQIRVQVPAPGMLSATATSSLPVPHTRQGERRQIKRTVARAGAKAPSETLTVVRLDLQLASHFRALASRGGGLSSVLTISFSAAGHPTLRKTIAIRFVHRHHRSKR